eukprot:UN20014
MVVYTRKTGAKPSQCLPQILVDQLNNGTVVAKSDFHRTNH